MKNIFKKVFALAMGLLLTVGASAQVNHFVKDDAAKRATIAKDDAAKLAIIENMDKAVTLQAGNAKVAAVTITADSTTATTAYLRFDKNDETTVYAIVLDRDGLVPLLLGYGYASSLDAAVAMMYSSGYYDAVAYNDTTMAVTGYLPGSTNTVYTLAFDASQSYAVSQGSFTMGTQGGTGVPVVTLLVTNITSSSMDVTTTMDGNTNIYYYAMTSSSYFVGKTDAEIISELQAANVAYATNLNYTETDLIPGFSYTYVLYPLNANNEPGTLIKQEFRTIGQGGEGTATVTMTLGNPTTTSFDVSVTMGDQTNLYYCAYADSMQFAGMTPEEIAADFQTQMSPTLEDIPTATVADLIPGTTYGVYAFPYNNNGELGTPNIQYIRTIAQGGDGTAEVTLTLTNSEDGNVSFATTMNDQTCYYYFGYVQSEAFAGATDDQIIEAVVTQLDPIAENIAGDLPMEVGMSYDFVVVPFNANREQGTFYKTSLVAGNVSISDANGVSYSVYPNPATSVLNVEGENIDRVEMYNALGQQVMTTAVNGTAAQFQVNALAKGAYILKVYSNGQASVQKVIVK